MISVGAPLADVKLDISQGLALLHLNQNAKTVVALTAHVAMKVTVKRI